MSFLGLIVRCVEEPYVTEFVNYYLKQGVDIIYIIDDNSTKEIYKDVIMNSKVHIFFDNDFIVDNNCVKIIYNRIRHLHEWLICVDMDEFITTKKNNNKTIREELETTFKNVDCIKIPWVIMLCNSIEKNPKSLLYTNTYRWNHNNKHINTICSHIKFRCRYEVIEVKCIFKTRCFESLNVHHPESPVNDNAIIVESITNTPSILNPFYQNLREYNIENGFLLCYHYRIMSIEQCLHKIRTSKIYTKWTLEDLLSFDYPEIIDETLKNKCILLN